MVRTTVMKNGYNGTRLGHAVDEQRCAKYREIPRYQKDRGITCQQFKDFSDDETKCINPIDLYRATHMKSIRTTRYMLRSGVCLSFAGILPKRQNG